MADSKDVEILVHITAPSKTSDDARYRSLASAYLKFQSATQLKLSNPPQPQHAMPDASPEGNRDGTSKRDTQLFVQSTRGLSQNLDGTIKDFIQPLMHSSRGPSQYFGSLKSPEASFGSALDNANSPSVPRKPDETIQRRHFGTPVQESQGSSKSPSSVIQDSYLEGQTTIAAYSSPTRLLENYLQTFDNSTQATHSLTEDSKANTTSEPSSQGNAANIPQDTKWVPPSVVPCTPVQRSPIASAIPRIGSEEQESSEGEVVDETFLRATPKDASIARADSKPPPSKKPKIMAAALSPRALLRTSSGIGPASSAENLRPTSSMTFLHEHGYTYDDLEVQAPDPPVSVTQICPENLITQSLAKMAHDLDITKQFRPQWQKRDLRPLERGYWLVNCAAWDQKLKRNGWAYLVNYVATGKAGWGVWCRRDIDFRWLRVYCWGIIVPHIYLLVYLASQRKVLYTGCSWLGADGEAVVTMGAKDRH